MKKNIFLAVVMGLAFGLPAFALDNPAPDLFVSFTSNDPVTIITTVIRWLLGFIGVIAILYLIIGGYQYLTSGMNSDLAKQGAKTIRNALTGLIIVILSYIIVVVVVNSLTRL